MRWKLTRQRIYILPTRHGWAMAGALLVMLIGATNYNNALAFLLTFLLAGVALVSMLHTYRELAGLSVEVLPATPVFAGDMARFPVVVDNPSALPRRGLRLRSGQREDRTSVGVPLQPEQRQQVEYAMHAARRGWFAPQRLCIASRAPIGLFRAWSWVPCQSRCLVYPRPVGDQPLPAPASGDSEAGWQRAVGDEEFSGLKSYRPGDPPRRIHWRAAGRSDPPPVKQFDADAGPDLELRYQDVQVHELEARLAQLAAWVVAAADAGASFALDLPGQRIASDRGSAQRERCLRALALMPADDHVATH